MPANNKFHLGDILTVITGWNLSPNGWDGACQLTNYMLDEGRTSRLSNGAILGLSYNLIPKIEKCKPCLLKQFPQLNDLKIDPKHELGEYSIDDEKFKNWLKNLEQKVGSEFEVKTIRELDKQNTNKQSSPANSRNSLFSNPEAPLPNAVKYSNCVKIINKYVKEDRPREFYLNRAVKSTDWGYLLRCISNEFIFSNQKTAIDIAYAVIPFDKKQAATAIAEIAYGITLDEHLTYDAYMQAKELSEEATALHPDAKKNEMVPYAAAKINELSNQFTPAFNSKY